MTTYSSLTITKGDDDSATFTVTRDGAAVNLTGMTVAWSAKANASDTSPALGPIAGQIIDAPGGEVLVTIPKASSAALTRYAYLWDAQVTDGIGNVVTVSRGILRVLDSITA